jgi:hypothetical protein
MPVADFLRPGQVISATQALQLRSKAVLRNERIGLLDPVVDETWARMSTASQKPSNYFDYFFSGQDIKVRIAEIPENDPDFGDLPLAQLAFNIEQEKQPIFGFWSYVYDSVMRGTRLVSGAFTLVTRYPNYMKEALAKAAANRVKNTHIDDYNYPQPLTEDDHLIDHYWGRNIYDPGIVAQLGSHLHSVHPPFDLKVTYNLETTAMPLQTAAPAWNQYYAAHYQDPENATMLDHNQRYAEFDPERKHNVLMLNNCEIKACQREFTPDGSVCMETYTFFARDLVVPEPVDAKLVATSAATPK